MTRLEFLKKLTEDKQITWQPSNLTHSNFRVAEVLWNQQDDYTIEGRCGRTTYKLVFTYQNYRDFDKKCFEYRRMMAIIKDGKYILNESFRYPIVFGAPNSRFPKWLDHLKAFLLVADPKKVPAMYFLERDFV